MFDKFKNYFTIGKTAKPVSYEAERIPVGYGRTIPVDANGDLVYATCLDILSRQMAQIKWGLYGTDNASIDSIMSVMQFALNVQPYPGINAYDFWKYMELQRLGKGNSYAYIHFGGGVRNLIPLAAENMEVIWDDANILEAERKIIYRYTDTVSHETYIFLPEELLHFKANSANGIVGRPSLVVLGDTLKANAEVESALRSAVANGWQGTIVLQNTSDLSESKKKALQNQVKELLKNSDKMILPLPPGTTATNIANDIKPYYELLKTTNAQAISSFFGIPLCMLNIGGGAGMATFSTNQLAQYHSMTIAPIIAQYANELTCKLLTRVQIGKGYAFDSNSDAFDFLDAQSKASVLVSYKANGILTANEARTSLKYTKSNDEQADRLLAGNVSGTLGNNGGTEGGRGNTKEGNE